MKACLYESLHGRCLWRSCPGKAPPHETFIMGPWHEDLGTNTCLDLVQVWCVNNVVLTEILIIQLRNLLCAYINDSSKTGSNKLGIFRSDFCNCCQYPGLKLFQVRIRKSGRKLLWLRRSCLTSCMLTSCMYTWCMLCMLDFRSTSSPGFANDCMAEIFATVDCSTFLREILATHYVVC